jgi:hypothetical protein
MDAVDFKSKDEHQCIPFNFEPTGQELAEIKRPPSIDDLIARVRANEGSIFSYARERAIDPLALRCRLLLHLPRLVTADDLPGERDIQQEILPVCDFLEESKRRCEREYTRSPEPPERPIVLGDLEFARSMRISRRCTMKASIMSAHTGPGIILHFEIRTAAGSSVSAALRTSTSNTPKKRSRRTLIRDRCSSFHGSLHFGGRLRILSVISGASCGVK